jgi:hypothetical protein
MEPQLFQLIQWLARSPDLNTVEQFWVLLKQRLSEFTASPRGFKELWEWVCSMYPNFSEHDCMALYEGMPRRIDTMLKSRGYWTNY